MTPRLTVVGGATRWNPGPTAEEATEFARTRWERTITEALPLLADADVCLVDRLVRRLLEEA